jgi:hypothetical protein
LSRLSGELWRPYGRYERGGGAVSYRQPRSLCSLASGYDCAALRAVKTKAIAFAQQRGRRRHTVANDRMPSHGNQRALPACDGENAAATPSHPFAIQICYHQTIIVNSMFRLFSLHDNIEKILIYINISKINIIQ